MKNNYNKKGFTLIELLVVIAIIGVLTAVLLVNLVGIRERGADAKKKSDLNQLKSALRLYYNDSQNYPSADDGGNILGCGSTGIIACEQDPTTNDPSTLQSASGTIYMKEVPEYTDYAVGNNNDTFYVGVTLNNASDPDAEASLSRCSVDSPETKAGIFYVCTD